MPALGALVGVPVGFVLFVRAEGFLLAAGACALAAACAVGCPPRSWGRRIAWGLSLGCAVGTALGTVAALLFGGSFNSAGL